MSRYRNLDTFDPPAAGDRSIVMTWKGTSNSGKPYTRADVKQIRQEAKQNTPTRVIAGHLGRTPAAVQQKASEQNISLKPTNQSPYNRKKG